MFKLNENNFNPVATDCRLYTQMQNQSILKYACMLPEPDGTILKLTLMHGLPAESFASLLGLHKRSLSHKITKLMKRINNPMFMFVADHFDAIPTELKTTARCAILHGLSTRKTAGCTGLTLHKVRTNLQILHACFKYYATGSSLQTSNQCHSN